MKTNKLLLVLLIAIILSACNNSPKVFKTDVVTDKKPWTNLNFNNDPDNFQFAIVSDRNGGNRPGVFDDAVNKLNIMRPEFVLSVGDLISGYTADTIEIRRQWGEVNKSLSNLGMPYFYLPGNHDITNKVMEKEWEKLYGRRYYNFIYKNTLFIILDSNDDDDFNLSRKQTDFVLNTLKENKDVRWTFILMHHPIWEENYNTDGRFNEIETALKDRKYTVIAGHEHHYNHLERNNSNYYVLSTTGAGSALRGNYFGEFDHITWITMNDQGPVMANLRLDGILSHDISNDKTEKLANSLLANTKLTNLMLCNKGDKFSNGTLYLTFKNKADSELNIKLNFFHHHQLQIENPAVDLTLKAGEEKVIEIPIRSSQSIDYKSIDVLCFDWEMGYNNPEYTGFSLRGKYHLAVEPTKIQFISNNLNVFIKDTEINFTNPFSNVESIYSINNLVSRKYNGPIKISETSKVAFQIKNNKDQYSSIEERVFEKSDFQEATNLENPKKGLKYSYYEGEWKSIPNFGVIEAKKTGVTDDFMVRDIAQREDHWGIVYTGYIQIVEDQMYQFQVKADDACRFYINDKLVVGENTIIKGENVGAIALKKGFHPVRIEYLEKEGNQRLRFYTKKNGGDEWIFMETEPFYYSE